MFYKCPTVWRYVVYVLWACNQFAIFECKSIVNLEAHALRMAKEPDEFGPKKGGKPLSEKKLYSLWMNFITSIIGARAPFSRRKTDVMPTRLT